MPPQEPLNLGRGGLSPYELAQSYRKVNPGMFDGLDDYELVTAIKKADPETYALMDPLLEGAELLMAKKPGAPPPPPRMVPPSPELGWGDVAVTTGLRVIPSMVGAVVGSGAGPVGTAGGGMIGAAAGEAAGQWYEKSFGPREEMSIPAVIFEGALGAYNPAATAVTTGRRLLQGARTGAVLGGVGASGRPVIEEGRLPTPTEVATGTALGAGFGGVVQGGVEGLGAAQRAAGAGLGDMGGMPPAGPPGPPPGLMPPAMAAEDAAPLQAAVRAQYEAEEAAAASRLLSIFPKAARPGGAQDFHTGVQAKTYLEDLAKLRQQPVALPDDLQASMPPAPPPQLALPPGRGTSDPNTFRAYPPGQQPNIELVGESAPPASRVMGAQDVGYVAPPPTFEEALEGALQAPPGPPRLVRPLELTAPPVEPDVPRTTSLFPPPRPSFEGPIEQGGIMGGRQATEDQPTIPGVAQPAHDRPYATGPNAGPRRKGEAHGTLRTVRRQVQTGRQIKVELVPSKLKAEDPGTYPPEVRRELAAMAWELEQMPWSRVSGGITKEMIADLTEKQGMNVADAVAQLRKSGASSGGAIAGAPVYHEIKAAAAGAHAHVTREEMLTMLRASLLEGRGNALTDAAAQVARGRLTQRGRQAAGETLGIQKQTSGKGNKRGDHDIRSSGNEGDDLIRWVDEEGTETLPTQHLDEWQRAAREADDSEIRTAVSVLEGEGPIREELRPFFDAAREEAVRRGLIKLQQPGLEMGGPGGDKGPSLLDFEGGPPEKPTALSELTGRRKARALANAAGQEELPPPPPTTPEQAAANAAYKAQLEAEGKGGPLPPAAPAQARLPHEMAGLPGLESAVSERQPSLPGTEGVRAQNIPTPEVADLPFALTPPPARPGKAAAPKGGLLDRLLDEQGVLIFHVPPGDRTGLKKFLKSAEAEHGGEAWYSRAEQAIEDGNWDRAWQAAASASVRSYAKAADRATTPQQLAALEASVRGTPLQDDLQTQIIAGARTRAGVGEAPRAAGYPPTKRVTQAGAARGKATVGPAGVLNPGERQRPLSVYDKEGKLEGGAAPELRAATLDKSVVRLIVEDLESPEGLATVPGNQDTYLRLFRQVGEQIYKGENLSLLRDAGVRIPPEELAQHWNATISDAGRTLQTLSAFAQAHRDILTEAAGRMDIGAALGGAPPRYTGARARVLSPKGQEAAQEVVDTVARTSQYHANALANDMQKRSSVGPLRALHDASYAWMLSKWNTAVRNYVSFTGRYSVDSLDHALTIPIARLTGEEEVGRLSRELIRERGLQPIGKAGTAVWPSPKGSWSDDLQTIYNFTSDSLATLKPEDARRAIRLLLDVPEQAAHFLGTATGEDLVADYSGTPVLRHLVNPKVQRVLTMFNRAQEFSARATVFDATTRALLRAKDLDPNVLLTRPVEEIMEAVGGRQAFDNLIFTATAQSLEATFAGRTSRDSIPGALIRFINEAWPTKLGVPFPRFNLSAAPRWIYDHSPAALFDWVRFPLDRRGITAPKGTLAGGRLYRGVRSREIQQVDLPLLQEHISVAERRQGEALQDLLGTQKEFSVRQRQIARLEKRAQQNLPGTADALTEARRMQDQLGRRRTLLKSQVHEQRTVVKDLESQQKKLLERVADATAINAPTYAQSIARMSTGTVGLLGAAWVIRGQEGARGTRWHEYRIDREGKDPIILDFRPLAPFAQYLYVADVLRDFYEQTDWQQVHQDLDEEGGIAYASPIAWTNAMWNRYQGKYTEGELGAQFGQAFLSISRAAGTTLTLADLMTQNGWPSLEDAARAIVGTIGQFFSRFTVPGQQVSDIGTAPFSSEEAKIRTPPKATTQDWERPLAGPIANIPFAKQLIPERISQTTGKAVATEYPLLRGLLGIGTAPRDFVVEEVRRVGVPGQSVYIKETGDYGLDRSIAESYATILKDELPSILESEQYLSLGTPALQRDFLQRSVFPILKRAALGEARQMVGEERYGEATVRGEEARRKARQQQMLDALEGELPPEEQFEEDVPPPPGRPETGVPPPPPPPF